MSAVAGAAAAAGAGGFVGAFSYSNHGGNGARGGFITVSANFSPSAGALQNWVDGSTANLDANAFKFSATTTGNTFTLDFGSPHEFNEWTGNFSISTGLGTWKLSGSNDNAAFTDLHTGFTLGGATSVTYTPPLTGAYRYYKWTQTGGVTQTSTRMIEGTFQIRNS